MRYGLLHHCGDKAKVILEVVKYNICTYVHHMHITHATMCVLRASFIEFLLLSSRYSWEFEGYGEAPDLH